MSRGRVGPSSDGDLAVRQANARLKDVAPCPQMTQKNLIFADKKDKSE